MPSKPPAAAVDADLLAIYGQQYVTSTTRTRFRGCGGCCRSSADGDETVADFGAATACC